MPRVPMKSEQHQGFNYQLCFTGVRNNSYLQTEATVNIKSSYGQIFNRNTDRVPKISQPPWFSNSA